MIRGYQKFRLGLGNWKDHLFSMLRQWILTCMPLMTQSSRKYQSVTLRCLHLPASRFFPVCMFMMEQIIGAFTLIFKKRMQFRIPCHSQSLLKEANQAQLAFTISILSLQEGLIAVSKLPARMCFATIYALTSGLELQH